EPLPPARPVRHRATGNAEPDPESETRDRPHEDGPARTAIAGGKDSREGGVRRWPSSNGASVAWKPALSHATRRTRPDAWKSGASCVIRNTASTFAGGPSATCTTSRTNLISAI